MDPRTSVTNETDQFPSLLSMIKNGYKKVATNTLLQVNGEYLPMLFLDNLPPQLRQHYNCNCCISFLRKFGGIVSVDGDGKVTSPLWSPDDVPGHFKQSVEALKKEVESSPVINVFLTSEPVIGTPFNETTSGGVWNHFSLDVPRSSRYVKTTLSSGQKRAEVREDVKILKRGLDEFSLEACNKALAYLTSGSFYRAEKADDRVEWIIKCKKDIADKSSEAVNNLLFLFAAKAPIGWAKIKSSIVGTLLEDIEKGLSTEQVKRNWETKMSGYMRATVAPTAGNVAAAEKVVAELDAAGSLERRYATTEDIKDFLWKSVSVKEERSKGVFSGLATKPVVVANVLELPSTKMSWAKFTEKVLPTVKNISMKVPNSGNTFFALTTASEADSPNILQWDNTVSWYYHGGVDSTIRDRVINAGGKYEDNDIRISLIWNNRDDLDLHVITPRHEEIAYYKKKSSCGGWLDVDMNVSGETDTPVENVRWSKGTAPRGQYKVVIHNFCNRCRVSVPFKLEVQIGEEVFTFEDRVMSRSRPNEVFTFEYTPNKPVKVLSASGQRAVVVNGKVWGLTPSTYVNVTGITLSPNYWQDEPLRHIGKHLFFLLEGCKDSNSTLGRGLFTEHLKSEFRPIRSTLEAHMARTVVKEVVNPACGVGINTTKQDWEIYLKVTTISGVQDIHIDRWD